MKGVKLRADKCEFLKQEVRYLGRLVSGDGFRVDPKDTEALERFREPPKNVGELRSLLGLFMVAGMFQNSNEKRTNSIKKDVHQSNDYSRSMKQ